MSEKINHYDKEQISRAVETKQGWIDLVNGVTGANIEGKKEGEPCPVCSAGTNRFVFDNSMGIGNNLCRKCDGGEGKSAKSRTGLKLIADIQGCTFDEACTLAGDWLKLTPPERYINQPSRPAPAPQEQGPQISEKDQQWAKKMISEALNGATDIEGTPAQRYLQSRGLKADYPIHNIRFNKIERYEKDQAPKSWQQNALIEKLTDPEGKLEGLQRVYLKDDDSKDTRKQTPKLTGNSNAQARASVKLFDPAEIMGIGEGIETALAAHELSNLPVWASLNSGRLKSWEPPAIAKTIFIFADLDVSNTGYAAAAELYSKLKKRDLEVYLLMPGTVIPEGKQSVDFLDFLNSVRGLTFSISQLKEMALEVNETEKSTGENHYQDWKARADTAIFPQGQVKTSQTTGKQTPKGTIDNLSRLLEYYSIQLRYNEIGKKPEYTFPNSASFINDGEDLKDNAAYGQIVDLMAINNMPTTNLDAYLQTLQQKHTYNPVKEWITSKPWNGYDYLADLLNTVTINKTSTDNPARREELKNRLIKKWLLGCCSLGMGIANEFPFVLVFQSHKQGIGKTYWFRKLCHSDWRVDGVTLDVGNVDSMREALSHWLCELGEVDGTIRKSSMDSIKAFLSRTKDELRTPYAKYSNKFKRRTAFMGTCNPTEFLRDDENRRFWVLAVEKVDSYHNIDMQQVWAQCLHMLKNGATHQLTDQEDLAVAQNNQEFMPEHVIEGAIRQVYDLSSEKTDFRQLTPQEILKESGFSATDRQKYSRICGRYLQKFFGEPKRSNGQTLYNVPPVKPVAGLPVDIGPFGAKGADDWGDLS